MYGMFQKIPAQALPICQNATQISACPVLKHQRDIPSYSGELNLNQITFFIQILFTQYSVFLIKIRFSRILKSLVKNNILNFGTKNDIHIN